MVSVEPGQNPEPGVAQATCCKFAFVATFLGSACGTLLEANPAVSTHFDWESDLKIPTADSERCSTTLMAETLYLAF